MSHRVNSISIQNLSKSYIIGKQKESSFRHALANVFKKRMKKGEHFWALKDVSFDVKQGEVIGIIGKNGAGKSTLLKVLSKITQPTEGRIEINGRVASLLEVGTGFHPELTGRENIYLNGTLLGMTRKEVAEKLEEIVEFSGVRKFIDTPVKHYSSGMYVRLAFSVAAHLEPEILIIDEVLAVGDAEFQKKCLGKMKDVSGEGRTVIFVSHDLAAVKKLCTKGILLKDGQKVFEGCIEETISEYRKAFVFDQLVFDVSDFSNRKRGNKFAVIESVELNKNYLSPKDTLEVCFSFKTLEDSIIGQKIDAAIFIMDNMDNCIYHLNLSALEIERVFNKDNKLKFVLKDLLLSKGFYTVNIHLSSNLVEFDYVEGSVAIEVNSDTIYSTDFIHVGKVFRNFEIQ